MVPVSFGLDFFIMYSMIEPGLEQIWPEVGGGDDRGSAWTGGLLFRVTPQQSFEGRLGPRDAIFECIFDADRTAHGSE